MNRRRHRAGSTADLAGPVLALLAQPGCGFCRHHEQLDRRAAWAFLYESRLAAEVLAEVSAAGGFCDRHTRLVYAVAAADDLTAGLASAYEAVIAADLRAIQRARRSRRHGAAPLPSGGCPLCRQRADAERRTAAAVADRFGADATARAAYRHSAGFCRPHLAMVAAGLTGEAAEWFLDDAAVRLAALAQRLAEYRRKRDHRFRDEPRGDEQRAPADVSAAYARQRFSEPRADG